MYCMNGRWIMGHVIAALDSTRRCLVCRHFYYSPDGTSEQLPIYPTTHGRMCRRCIQEVLWLDFRGKGRDPIAYLGSPWEI